MNDDDDDDDEYREVFFTSLQISLHINSSHNICFFFVQKWTIFCSEFDVLFQILPSPENCSASLSAFHPSKAEVFALFLLPDSGHISAVMQCN